MSVRPADLDGVGLFRRPELHLESMQRVCLSQDGLDHENSLSLSLGLGASKCVQYDRKAGASGPPSCPFEIFNWYLRRQWTTSRQPADIG